MIAKKYSSLERSVRRYWSSPWIFALCPRFFALPAKSVASLFELPVSVPYTIVIFLVDVFVSTFVAGVLFERIPFRYPLIQMSSSLVEVLINSSKLFNFCSTNMGYIFRLIVRDKLIGNRFKVIFSDA